MTLAETLLVLPVVLGTTGCFYTQGNVNLMRSEDPVVTFEAHDRKDEALRNLGRVRATARGWLFAELRHGLGDRDPSGGQGGRAVRRMVA